MNHTRRITVFMLLLGVCFCAVSHADVYTDNVVILLDDSGSMSGNKIAQAKIALKELLDILSPTKQVGLLTFSGWKWPLDKPRDDAALKRIIDQIGTPSGTPLGEYIKYGADALIKKRREQYGFGTYHLFVVTDGEATDGRLMWETAPQVRTRGLRFDVIGVEMGKDHDLKQWATYHKVDDAASLKSVVKDIFAEGGKDASKSANYEELLGLNPDVALAMLGALAGQQRATNFIGEEDAPPLPVHVPVGASTNPPSQQQQSSSQNQQAYDPYNPPSASNPLKVLLWIAAAVFGVVLVIGILSALGSTRNNRW